MESCTKDPLNINIYEHCSYGKFKFIPYTQNGAKGGVLDLFLKRNLNGQSDSSVFGWVRDKLKDRFGASELPGVDNTLVMVPKGVVNRKGRDDWLAWAYTPGHWGVYNDEWILMPTTMAHEVGHNLNLQHANHGAQEYGDESGIMGFGNKNRDGPVLCFNGPNMWYLGWFPDREATYRVGEGTKTYRIVGSANYRESQSTDLIILRVGRLTYVSLNRAVGNNKGTKEFRDKVLVHTWEGADYSGKLNPINKKSWIVADLGENGEYRNDQEDFVIKVKTLDLTGTLGYAMVEVTSSTDAKKLVTWIPLNLQGCEIDGDCLAVTYRDNQRCVVEAGRSGKLRFMDGGFQAQDDGDALIVNHKLVRTESDLPAEGVKDGKIVRFVTNFDGRGNNFKLCMQVDTGGPDPCEGVKCRDPTACENTGFCFGGTCHFSKKAKGTSCDDGNKETTDDVCDAAGVCAGVNKCIGVSCNPTQCQTGGTCDFADGQCKYTNQAAGTECNDGRDFTINDVCDDSGNCAGEIDPNAVKWELTEDKGNDCKAEGSCISSSEYGDNEKCKFKARVPGTLSISGDFQIEAPWDKMIVDGKKIDAKGSNLPDTIKADGEITWTSDGSVNFGGWTVCMGDAPPTPSPVEPAVSPPVSPPAPGGGGSLNAQQREFFGLVNAERAAANINAATIDCKLATIAQNHAQNLADDDCWTNPQTVAVSSFMCDGSTRLSTLASNAGTSYRLLQLAGGDPASNAASAFNQWSGLMRNAVVKSYGVGFGSGGKYGHYATLLVRLSPSTDTSCTSGVESAVGEAHTLSEGSIDDGGVESAVSGEAHILSEGSISDGLTRDSMAHSVTSSTSSFVRFLALVGSAALIYSAIMAARKVLVNQAYSIVDDTEV